MTTSSKVILVCLAVPALGLAGLVGLALMGVILDPDAVREQEAKEAQRAAREAVAAEQRREREAAMTPEERLERRVVEVLHKGMGVKQGVFSEEWKWEQLRGVEVMTGGVVEVRMKAAENFTTGMARAGALLDVGEVMKSGFGIEEVSVMKVVVETTYQDTYGKRTEEAWISTMLERGEAEKVEWENLAGSKIEKLLREKGAFGERR